MTQDRWKAPRKRRHAQPAARTRVAPDHHAGNRLSRGGREHFSTSAWGANCVRSALTYALSLSAPRDVVCQVDQFVAANFVIITPVEYLGFPLITRPAQPVFQNRPKHP
jgi:hypothetical protein